MNVVWKAAQSIWLPDDGRICLANYEPDWPQFESNHNVFRLDRDGGVVWQIKRDEGECTLWARARQAAEAANSHDSLTRSPFTWIYLQFPDGSMNVDRTTCKFPDNDNWIEGAVICCSTYDSRTYELDVETGVARVVSWSPRPW